MTPQEYCGTCGCIREVIRIKGKDYCAECKTLLATCCD